jgi:hypothetical protein
MVYDDDIRYGNQTLEDFITPFLFRPELTNEVSNDVRDNNARWCLGQFLKIPYADLVPTRRWFRDVGRVRLGHALQGQLELYV